MVRSACDAVGACPQLKRFQAKPSRHVGGELVMAGVEAFDPLQPPFERGHRLARRRAPLDPRMPPL